MYSSFINRTIQSFVITKKINFLAILIVSLTFSNCTAWPAVAALAAESHRSARAGAGDQRPQRGEYRSRGTRGRLRRFPAQAGDRRDAGGQP